MCMLPGFGGPVKDENENGALLLAFGPQVWYKTYHTPGSSRCYQNQWESHSEKGDEGHG